MSSETNDSLIYHLDALRTTLVRCLAVTAILYPFGYYASGPLIDFLIDWSFGDRGGQLHYFSLMEVMIMRLKLALVLALAAAYPWNIYQVWKFLLPALYDNERRAIKLWILFASVLFLAGVMFCLVVILPLIVNFSYSFASDKVKQMLGLANFLDLAGWMSLAFGVMFQAPIAVMLAVRFGLVSTADLRAKRPYIVVAILILAAILTPPDVVSQCILGAPTWLLFELGILLASRMEKKFETADKGSSE